MPKRTLPKLSVDDRREKPFRCSLCGDGYDACHHWGIEGVDSEDAQHPRNTLVEFVKAWSRPERNYSPPQRAMCSERVALGLVSNGYVKIIETTGRLSSPTSNLKASISQSSDEPDPYPQHTRLLQINRESQAIGEFVNEFLRQKKIFLAQYHQHGEDCSRRCRLVDTMQACPLSLEKLLAEHFGINLTALEDEKRSLLDRQRKLNQI